MRFVVSSIKDLKPVVEAVSEQTEKFSVICLNGDLGSGKTTLVKALAKAFNVQDPVSSPTYSLINEYITESNEIIYHFDFYRLKDEEEALDIGVEEYFYNGNICLIEWSNMFPDLIPAKHLEINIKLVEEKNREITLVEHG